jgi:PmbA protein
MDYLELAKGIAGRGAGAGPEIEAYIQLSTETQIKVSQGKVEQLSQATSRGLGVRVIDEGRMGYAYTSDFEQADAALDEALQLARGADADSHRALPEPQPLAEASLAIYDPAVDAAPMERRVEMALAIEEAALASDRRVVATTMCTYLDGVAHVYLANSRGFAGRYAKSTVGGFLLAVARDEAGQTMGLGVGLSPFLAEIDPVAIGREAGEKAVRILGGKPVETQRATVVFDPVTAAELVGWLAQALTAEAMQRERSFLIDRMGQDVASDRVTLLDNGRLPRGIGSAPFDAEGVPTSATKLIDEGVLQAVLHDSYTARRGGARSTGNAARESHRSLPKLAPSNFYLQPGPTEPEAIISEVERGLYVTNTMNVGGINPVSGDFSVGASGLWIENGRLARPVTGVTVGSTLGEILQNIVEVGNDLRFLPFAGAIGAPTIRVEGMIIGGRGE